MSNPTFTTVNGITFSSGTNTFTITLGTASIVVPAGMSGTLGSAAFTASSAYYAPGGTDVAVADGGTGASTASGARTNLGATTAGANIFTLTNPSAITFLKVAADNTVSAESAATHRTSLGATTVGANLFTLTNPGAITFLRLNADNTVTAQTAATQLSSLGAAASGANTDLTSLQSLGNGSSSSVAIGWTAAKGIYRTSGGTYLITDSVTGTDQWTLNAGLTSQTATRVGSGTVGAPSFSFVPETTSGIWRNGAGDIQFSVASATVTKWAANSFSTIAGTSTQFAKVGGAVFDHYANASTSHTDGTEDTIYTDTTVASTLGANGDKLHAFVYIATVASATASRRIKQYFGGTLIFDSGTITLALGTDFSIYTEIIRDSSTTVRCVVSVTTTSASTVPYSTYTSVTGLTLSSTNIFKTTGIAASTGAASGDIVAKHGWIQWMPAA